MIKTQTVCGWDLGVGVGFVEIGANKTYGVQVLKVFKCLISTAEEKHEAQDAS